MAIQARAPLDHLADAIQGVYNFRNQADSAPEKYMKIAAAEFAIAGLVVASVACIFTGLVLAGVKEAMEACGIRYANLLGAVSIDPLGDALALTIATVDTVGALVMNVAKPEENLQLGGVIL